MSEKKTIKVIKKGEKPRPIVKVKAATARETARDMVETVTNWVTTGTAPPRCPDCEDFFDCTAARCVDEEENQ